MKLVITVDLDHAAFRLDPDGVSEDEYETVREGAELGRILRQLGEYLGVMAVTTSTKRVLRDYNGNRVGEMRVTEEQ